MHAALDARTIRQHAAPHQILQPAPGLVAARFGRRDRSADGRLHQLLRAVLRLDQVLPQPQLGHHRPADGGRVVDDPLANALLHSVKLPHLTPGSQWLISARLIHVLICAEHVGWGVLGGASSPQVEAPQAPDRRGPRVGTRVNSLERRT